MVEAESKTIGDYTFTIQKPLGRQGAHMALRIGKWAFPFYGHFMASNGDPAIVMRAVGDVLNTLSGDEIDYLNTTLGALTQVSWTDEQGRELSATLDGKTNDRIFQDALDMWLTWLIFALQTTMRSFFNGALSLGAKLKASDQAQPTMDHSASRSPNSAERTG